MKILDVYKRFDTPPNLQEHMIRVFGIVTFLEKHWIGENLDWKMIKDMALLHDLGNIIKYQMDKYPEMLGNELANIGHWKQVQQKIMKRYGSDDEEATKQMLKEISVDPKIIDTIFNKTFGNSVAVKNSSDWYLKLLYYADLRTLPSGVGSLEERLKDVRNRMPKYTSRPDFEDLVSACLNIGLQVVKNLNISETEVTNQSTSVDLNTINNYQV
jgi:hypothetical protein